MSTAQLRQDALLRANRAQQTNPSQLSQSVMSPQTPQQQTQQHLYHSFHAGIPHTPSSTPSFSPQQQQQTSQPQTASDLAHSARKEWKQHGQYKTQQLEELRVNKHNPSPSDIAVQIVGTTSRVDGAGQSYTAYMVQVWYPHNNNGARVTLEKRYSDFDKLQSIVQLAAPPAFPPKHWAGRMGNWTPSLLLGATKSHDALLQSRQQQLDIWLVHLLANYNANRLVPPHKQDAVRQFLQSEPKLPYQQQPVAATQNGKNKNNKWNNPFTFTLGSALRQATQTAQLIAPKLPRELLETCRGVIFLTILKAGCVVSGRLGTGVWLKKQRPGVGWSAPCAVGTVGVGGGAVIGGDVTHCCIVLTEEADFSKNSSALLQLGAEYDVAVGPASAADTLMNSNPVFAVSQGLFVGISLEGSVIKVREDVNAKFYGHKVDTEQLMSWQGQVPAAEPLYQQLHAVLS